MSMKPRLKAGATIRKASAIILSMALINNRSCSMQQGRRGQQRGAACTARRLHVFEFGQ